jgi:peptide chain release factor subunit 1
MKLVSRDQAEKLARFKSDKFLTTSFFLDTDKSRRTKKEIVVSAKNLVSSGRERLAGLDASKDARASLERDLAAIEAFVVQNMRTSAAGSALYANSGAGLWEVFDLPEAPKDRLVFDRTPYVLPIALILDQYRKMIVLVLDQREAEWYEYCMGGLTALAKLSSEVPKRLKGGVLGRDLKHPERRFEALLLGHYKRVAQQTMDLFQKNHYDGVFVGCHDGTCAELEPVLHTYVKDRLRGRIKVTPGDSQDRILKESQALERELRRKDEDARIGRFLSELEKGGRAAAGLRESLKHLNTGKVQELLVTRGFAAPGTACPRCRFLYLDELRCPSCDRKTNPVLDVVDEAVQKAWEKRDVVSHITPPSKLDRFGKVGAFLRFKA